MNPKLIFDIAKVHSPDWDTISSNAKDFIKKLIQCDPNIRMSSADALAHPWMKEGATQEKTGPNLSRVGDNLVKHFNARKKLKVRISFLYHCLGFTC